MKKLIVFLLVVVSVSANAQTVKDFALSDVTNGKIVHLSDYASGSGVVVIFASNACPFDDYYLDRIKSLTSTNIPVVLINAGLEDTESTAAMVTRARQKGISFPYLADKDQVVLADLNAHKSTEAYVLKNTDGKFSIYYHGAIDDNPQVAADVKHSYLREAISSLVAGKPNAAVENRPVGCVIRRK